MNKPLTFIYLSVSLVVFSIDASAMIIPTSDMEELAVRIAAGYATKNTAENPYRDSQILASLECVPASSMHNWLAKDGKHLQNNDPILVQRISELLHRYPHGLLPEEKKELNAKLNEYRYGIEEPEKASEPSDEIVEEMAKLDLQIDDQEEAPDIFEPVSTIGQKTKEQFAEMITLNLDDNIEEIIPVFCLEEMAAAYYSKYAVTENINSELMYW